MSVVFVKTVVVVNDGSLAYIDREGPGLSKF